MTVREKNEFRVCVVEIPAQNIQLPEIGLEKKKLKSISLMVVTWNWRREKKNCKN